MGKLAIIFIGVVACGMISSAIGILKIQSLGDKFYDI